MEEGNIKAEDMIASQGNEGKGLQEDSVCGDLGQRGFGSLGAQYKTIQEEEIHNTRRGKCFQQ